MYHPDGPTFLELMRQALASTERGYDLIAPKFDNTPFRTPEPVLAAMMRALREDGGVAGGPIRSGLDVCCGTGAALRHLRAICTENVIGLDFSQGMLDEARRRLTADHQIEVVGAQLRAMMPWIAKNKLVDQTRN